LKNQAFIEGQQPGQAGKYPGNQSRTAAEPLPGCEDYEPDGDRPEGDLQQPNGGVGVGEPEARGQNIYIERRDEVGLTVEPQVAGEHLLGQRGVGGRIEARVGLGHRVVLQLEDDHDFQQKNRYQ
jgi:hypothetical protein